MTSSGSRASVAASATAICWFATAIAFLWLQRDAYDDPSSLPIMLLYFFWYLGPWLLLISGVLLMAAFGRFWSQTRRSRRPVARARRRLQF